MSLQWPGSRAVKPTATVGPFVEGLLGAVALGQLTSADSAALNGIVAVAIGMGVVAAVFAVTGEWLSQLVRWFYSALGFVAAVPAAVAFVKSNGCLPGPPPVLRFVALVLLMAVAGWMFTARALLTRSMSPLPAGLALFGAIQILVGAATFIAGNGSSGNLVALAVMIGGAALLGWLAVVYSDGVLAVAGAAFGMQSIYQAASAAGCGRPNFNGVVLIVVFCGTYAGSRAVSASFRSRR